MFAFFHSIPSFRLTHCYRIFMITITLNVFLDFSLRHSLNTWKIIISYKLFFLLLFACLPSKDGNSCENNRLLFIITCVMNVLVIVGKQKLRYRRVDENYGENVVWGSKKKQQNKKKYENKIKRC